MERKFFAGRTLAAARSWRPAVAFTLLLSYFVLLGVIIGGQGVLWADLIQRLGLSKSTFGTAQLLSPLISVGLLLAGGQLAARWGKKLLGLTSLVVLGCSVLLLAGAGSLAGLLLALALAGFGTGLLETAMNGGTLDWEQATGRSAMNVMHAGFSGGAVLGALTAGALLGMGWSYPAVLVLLASLCGLALAASLPVGYPPVETSGAVAQTPTSTMRLIFGTRSLAVLALVSLLGVFGEGVAFLWAVIYLRELGAQAIEGGAAFALFNSAMFLGRLLNAPLVERAGARASLLISGVLVVVATALLVSTHDVTLAIAAFVILGFAVAGPVPTALTVAARIAPGNSGTIAGGIMAAVYATFIISPPLVGYLADLFSLRAALLTVGVSGLGILWLAHGVERK